MLPKTRILRIAAIVLVVVAFAGYFAFALPEPIPAHAITSSFVFVAIRHVIFSGA